MQEGVEVDRVEETVERYREGLAHCRASCLARDHSANSVPATFSVNINSLMCQTTDVRRTAICRIADNLRPVRQ